MPTFFVSQSITIAMFNNSHIMIYSDCMLVNIPHIIDIYGISHCTMYIIKTLRCSNIYVFEYILTDVLEYILCTFVNGVVASTLSKIQIIKILSVWSNRNYSLSKNWLILSAYINCRILFVVVIVVLNIFGLISIISQAIDAIYAIVDNFAEVIENIILCHVVIHQFCACTIRLLIDVMQQVIIFVIFIKHSFNDIVITNGLILSLVSLDSTLVIVFMNTSDAGTNRTHLIYNLCKYLYIK